MKSKYLHDKISNKNSLKIFETCIDGKKGNFYEWKFFDSEEQKWKRNEKFCSWIWFC